MAQSSVGVWIDSTQFKSTDETEAVGIPGATAKLKFGHKTAFGLSLNHFSGPNVSTEFAAQQIRGQARVSVNVTQPTFNETVDLGAFRANVLSGILQWHFMPRSLISPYVGGGVAYFTGAKLNVAGDAITGAGAETVKFDNKFGFMLNGGVDFAVMKKISIALDARYAPYKARDKSDPDPVTNSTTLNPTIVSLGVRFHM